MELGAVGAPMRRVATFNRDRQQAGRRHRRVRSTKSTPRPDRREATETAVLNTLVEWRAARQGARQAIGQRER